MYCINVLVQNGFIGCTSWSPSSLKRQRQDVLPLLFSTAVDAALRAATDTLGGCGSLRSSMGHLQDPTDGGTVNSHVTMERSTMLSMGKSTISTGPFSIANC